MHHIVVAGVVVLKPVVWQSSRDHFAFSGSTQLAAPGTLRYLRPLELCKLIKDTVRALAFGRIVAADVEGADLRTIILEFPPK